MDIWQLKFLPGVKKNVKILQVWKRLRKALLFSLSCAIITLFVKMFHRSLFDEIKDNSFHIVKNQEEQIMKKKILAMALSFTLAFSMAACGSPQVSGPVDRDIPNSSSDSASDESSSGTSAEESPDKSSTALTDWYNSNDRTVLEDSINAMFANLNMTFSVSVEEPDTIIYTYQYTQTMSDESNRQELHDYFDTTLNETYEEFINDIRTYKNNYGLPVTTLRVTYLDLDGTSLYSIDFTEDYVPSGNGTSSGDTSQTFASLEDWINSDEQKALVNAINQQFESVGATIDFYAEGNVLVMDFTATEQMDLGGTGQDDITRIFESQIASAFSDMGPKLFDSFESDYGLVLDDIKIVFQSYDGTELFSKYFSEI